MFTASMWRIVCKSKFSLFKLGFISSANMSFCTCIEEKKTQNTADLLLGGHTAPPQSISITSLF